MMNNQRPDHGIKTQPIGASSNNSSSISGTRGIWGQLMSKYAPTGEYPLGMTSAFAGSADTGSKATKNTVSDSSVVWRPYESTHSSASSSEPAPEKLAANTAAANLSPEPLDFDPEVMRAISLNRQPNFMMTVKEAAVCHDNPDEHYKMTAQPRGYCLIVNNVDFEHDMFPTRKGSDQDANRFDQLFRQLGFETIMTRNLTADQMRNKFQELAQGCRPEHDALFVFILSHGSELGIYGTDGFEVYLESEILACFDNRNCKAMIGKPKVFVIQACRGSRKDFGGGDTTDSIAIIPNTITTTTPTKQNNRVPASWLPSSNQLANEKNHHSKHPIQTDMLLVFSCLAGFVSVRNETAGSWLGVALAYFIMTHAHERDLLNILHMVTRDIHQRVSSNGHMQSIELKLLGWTKSLYFNPGRIG